MITFNLESQPTKRLKKRLPPGWLGRETAPGGRRGVGGIAVPAGEISLRTPARTALDRAVFLSA